MLRNIGLAGMLATVAAVFAACGTCHNRASNTPAVEAVDAAAQEQLLQPVTLDGNDHPCFGPPFELRRSLRSHQGMQGKCRFGDRMRAVRVWDMDGDGRFGPRSQPNVSPGQVNRAPVGDVVVVYQDETFDHKAGVAFIDRCIFLDGMGYQLKLSADGTRLSATPFRVETGQIRVDHDIWNGQLVGQRFLFDIPDSNQTPVTLPQDHYAFAHLEQRIAEPLAPRQRQQYPDGRTVLNSYVDGTGVGTKAGFDVVPGQCIVVNEGTPLTGAIDVHVCRHDIFLGLSMSDAMGNYVEHIYPKCRHLNEPTIAVFDAAGRKIHSGKMFWNTYNETYTYTYRMPLHYTGTFTARMEWDIAPLEGSTREATFTVD